MSGRIIGLALSGGGSRAAAFHLGCLRALHDRDLLERIRVVSGVSGGSLLAALWAYGPTDFREFDEGAEHLLRRGLRGDIVRRVLRPTTAIRNLTAAASVLASRALGQSRNPRARSANRTDCLAEALSDIGLGSKTMSEVSHGGLGVVLTATNLRTGHAIRFGSESSSCSRFGTIAEPIEVATAVAASAAFPLLLPAVERTYTFIKNGSRKRETVLMSDGGVYDNLGLSVLAPGRSRTFTPHVYDVPYIVSCDAGRGPLRPRSPHFLVGRASRSFEIVHQRAQNEARARLHEWSSSKLIDGFVMAYLGMRDERLPSPPVDLVSKESVATYATNFSPMDKVDFELLSDRGTQLIQNLMPIYCPRLIS